VTKKGHQSEDLGKEAMVGNPLIYERLSIKHPLSWRRAHEPSRPKNMLRGVNNDDFYIKTGEL